MLTSSLSIRIRSFIAAGLILIQATLPCLVWAQPAVQPVTAGVVDSLSGEVFIRKPPSLENIPAKPGDLVGPGSVVVTRNGGEAILLFVDGQHIVMSENSTLRVDDYRFNPQDPKLDRAVFSLLDGAMRVVTGAMHLANRNALTIAAGSVSIGVRSEEVSSFVVEIHEKDQQENFAAAIVGEISVVSRLGPPVTVAEQQFVTWQSNSAPTKPQGLDAAPPELATAMRIAAGAALDEKTIAELKKLLNELESPAAGQELRATLPAATALTSTTPGPGGGGGCSGTSPC